MSLHNNESNAMSQPTLTYDQLRQAVLTAHGECLAVELLDAACLEALIDLGIVVRVGGGLIEATSHGLRLHGRLQRGEHLKELDPQPPPPVYD
jgi:hypothetical protein